MQTPCEFYYAEPIELNEDAYADGDPARYRLARFWRLCDHDPARAWIVCWRSVNAPNRPTIKLVPLAAIRVSQRPDPPAMPGWADDKTVPAEGGPPMTTQEAVEAVVSVCRQSLWGSLYGQ